MRYLLLFILFVCYLALSIRKRLGYTDHAYHSYEEMDDHWEPYWAED